MNLSDLRKYVLPSWSTLLVLLSVTAVAAAGGPPKNEGHSTGGGKPASHAAPAHNANQGGHAGGGGGQHAQASRPSSNRAAGNHQAAGGGRAAGSNHANQGGGQHNANTNHAGSAGGRPAGAGGNRPGAGAGAGRTANGNRGNAGAGRPAGGGGNHVAAAGGRAAGGGHTPAGTRNVALRGGGSANIRSNGQIRSVNRNGMQINHGLHGGRTVVGMHNGARVVNTGRNGGYVQRSYMNRGGHAYYSRTYYRNGHYYAGVYRGYNWHGHAYFGFYPGVWYHPGFYAWGYHPWGAPVFWGIGVEGWGWGGAPWYGYYGGWFAPYPSYVSPAFWLTDYLIAADLQASYEARQEAAADDMAANQGGGDAPVSGSGTIGMTPEVKQAIADEVRAQLAEQESQAGQNNGGGSDNGGAAPTASNSNDQVPPALDPARRTFVVDGDLSVTANGQECGLTAGDVLTRLTDTPDADNMVNASVSASKKSDCASGQTVAVKVDDLQEMQNHFAEQVNNGLGELAKKQGTGGIPKGPDASTVASDVPPPAPDTTAAQTLQDQQKAADQTEAEVKQQAASGGQE
jgi:hypothetical protein